MNKFLETVMNFINENTTLLIIICVFLIFVLIGYLIDNSIKTKKMEKNLVTENSEDISEPVEVKEEVNESVVEEQPIVSEEPVIENTEPVVPEETTQVSITEIEEPVVETNENDTPSVNNEIAVDPKINEMLLRDFSNNTVQSESTIEEATTDEVTLNPIENVVPIDEIIPKVEVPSEPVEEVKEEKSIYKNDKKLSDIFKKKEEPVLEKTEDYSKELDRILQKLNETSSDITDDSTLDETTDFTNMF